MKRSLLILALIALNLLGGSGMAIAQADDNSAIMESIVKAGRDMKSMKCTFVQTVSSTLLQEKQMSEGSILYLPESRLRIAYTKPDAYAISIEDGRMSMTRDGATHEVQGTQNRIFQGIATMVMGFMNGDALTDSKLFNSSVSVQDGSWVVRLDPRRKDLKRLFSAVVLTFDPSTSLLRSMEMIQSDGGSTGIHITKAETGGDYEAEW